MKKENILEAIISATNHIQNSMQAFREKNEDELIRTVWRALADLEYALFLFSLKNQDDALNSLLKLDSHSKQFEVRSTLASAQDILKEAKANFEANEHYEAQKKTWTARSNLLSVYEFFEKKWRKGERFAST